MAQLIKYIPSAAKAVMKMRACGMAEEAGEGVFAAAAEAESKLKPLPQR